MGPDKGMLGIWTDGPYVVITTFIETLDTVIQVVCWVELPEQRRLYPIFVKIWIPRNGTQQCGIGSLDIHRNFPG